jgi:hypothetical protein
LIPLGLLHNAFDAVITILRSGGEAALRMSAPTFIFKSILYLLQRLLFFGVNVNGLPKNGL